jgi:ornithine cyclodeaminase
MLPGLAEVAEEAGLPFEAVSLEGLREADVVISITSSFDAIFGLEHISPGTHVACMGTDTIGKQECGTDLIEAARVYTDEVAQSISIGETQHAIKSGLISQADVGELGAVINGTDKGRESADDITLFDGTGVGLQDLAVAQSVVDIAVERGVAIEVDF